MIKNSFFVANLILFAVLFTHSPTLTHANSNTKYTDYKITIDEAVDIQMNDGASPITDKYQHDPVYVNMKNIKLVNPTVNQFITDVRTEPNRASDIAYQFTKTTPIHITDVITANNEKWYEMKYRTKTYYVLAQHVAVWQVEAQATTAVYQYVSEDAHTFNELEQGERLTMAPSEQTSLHQEINAYGAQAIPVAAVGHQSETKLQYIKTFYKNWRKPNSEDVKNHLDPELHSKTQHIRLDKSVGATTTELNKVLEGNGILEDEGKAFKKGSEKTKINEVYLIAHAIHETAAGTSQLATGVEVGKNEEDEPTLVTNQNKDKLRHIKKVYNMYGIGAADSCPLECGAIKAYENGWTTPELAIAGGAEWIRDSYIHNNFNQNTLYKMKWNPKMADGQKWKQYATDIGWAIKQTDKMEEIYAQLPEAKYFYDIPVFEE